MDALSKNALAKLAFFQLLIAVLLFLPAWTLHFWQAWLSCMVFTAAQLIITVYFLCTDPHLIENRLKAGPGAESRPAQKLILFFAVILSLALVVLPGLDHRLGWSVVPVPSVLLGDLGVVAGMSITFFVFRANTHAAATVKVEENQQVIATGLYSIVRRPLFRRARSFHRHAARSWLFLDASVRSSAFRGAGPPPPRRRALLTCQSPRLHSLLSKSPLPPDSFPLVASLLPGKNPILISTVTKAGVVYNRLGHRGNRTSTLMQQSSSLRIRLAALSDAPQLTPMRHALWPESSRSHHAAELTAVLDGTSQRVYPLRIFVAENSDGSLIGFLEANLRSAADGCDEKLPVGYVEGWFVAEPNRRKGVGAALLRAAEDWARTQGCHEMASDTDIENKLSQHAHEASGFTIAARAILYRKSL